MSTENPGWGRIFMYSCSVKLFSFVVNFISKEMSRVKTSELYYLTGTITWS